MLIDAAPLLYVYIRTRLRKELELALVGDCEWAGNVECRCWVDLVAWKGREVMLELGLTRIFISISWQ